MQRRSSEAAALVEVLVDRIERVAFPFTDEVRAGFPERGVKNGQRMIGHIESIGFLCEWAIIDMGLDLNSAFVTRLCRYHDLAKAMLGDEARVPLKEVGKPTGKITARIKQLVKSGLSVGARKDELSKALQVLRPEFYGSPLLWREIEETITAYYISSAKRKREVDFVWSMGQVLDAHFGLWYASQKRMDTTPINVRTLTDELEARLRHWVARLYWQIVKDKYFDILIAVYPSKTSARDQ